jgi:hypothetical protein
MLHKDENKVVAWVLGSGFSKSLGGPLLADLFRRRDELGARGLLTTEMHSVYDIFTQCVSRGYVEHAEQFLEFVDTVPKNPTRAAMLAQFGNLTKEQVRDAAIKIVATECDFLYAADTNDEVWDPYKAWASSLPKDHHIITFNYDLVPEALGLAALMPAEDSLNKERRVIKLHGSINWKQGQSAVEEMGPEEMRRHDTIPVIGTPGPTKSGHRSKRFKKLWEFAAHILRMAHVVVFVGYRFPPSDSQALSSLLGALRKSDNLRGSGALRQGEAGRHIRIHTVLGPRTGDDDTVRLRKLLEHTMASIGCNERLDMNKSVTDLPTYDLRVHPLYAQDFFAVLHDSELYGLGT